MTSLPAQRNMQPPYFSRIRRSKPKHSTFGNLASYLRSIIIFFVAIFFLDLALKYSSGRYLEQIILESSFWDVVDFFISSLLFVILGGFAGCLVAPLFYQAKKAGWVKPGKPKKMHCHDGRIKGARLQ